MLIIEKYAQREISYTVTSYAVIEVARVLLIYRLVVKLQRVTIKVVRLV